MTQTSTWNTADLGNRGHRRNESQHRLGQQKQSKSELVSRIGAKDKGTMNLADATRHLSRNCHQDCRYICSKIEADASQPVSRKYCDNGSERIQSGIQDSKKIDVHKKRINEWVFIRAAHGRGQMKMTRLMWYSLARGQLIFQKVPVSWW